MTIEKQFINKSYYETFLIENEQRHPMEVLGALYRNGERHDEAALAYVRFAQGEVYYHSNDLESAIFKWEKVDHELQPWAMKNIADCYFELGMLDRAEELYISIVTESSTLITEISLQLFALYIQQKNTEFAFKVIQEAVAFNPDYPNVTSLARAFYEEQYDWESAIELATKEAIRTGALSWFATLKGYVKDGHTKGIVPGYFYEMLLALHKIDQAHFVQMVAALWQSYKVQDSYPAWMQMINMLFAETEINRYDSWEEISVLYGDAYREFMGGRYFIHELHDVMPGLVTNWLKLTRGTQVIFPAAAVLAWGELFPETIEEAAMQSARSIMSSMPHSTDILEQAVSLFDSIVAWAQHNDLQVGPRWSWWARELAKGSTHHLLVAGRKGNGTSTFLHSLLQENVSGYENAATIAIQDGLDTSVTIMNEQDMGELPSLEAFDELGASFKEGDFVHVKLPSGLLHEHQLTLLAVPELQSEELLEYAGVSDGIAIVLNVNEPFTDRERGILLKVRQQLPHVAIHFILNKMDTIYSEHEAMRIIENTRLRIHADFPGAAVIPYSSLYTSRQQQGEIADFLIQSFRTRDVQQGRAAKLIFLMKRMIMQLIRKREEKERGLVASIKWNEDVLTKMQAAIHQLQDLQQEKSATISKAYRTVKEAIQEELLEQIPELLRACSNVLSENSDFRNIHLQLNEEMNKRVQGYLTNRILPESLVSIQEWIETASEELRQDQEYLNEMRDGFNSLYEEEYMQLDCDFRVVDDWQRDADRITSALQIGEINVFLRSTPSQFFLKSASKLFGSFGQNRSMLYNQYKKHIETEDYSEIAADITSKFLLQFELLEGGLVRDVGIFFREPKAILTKCAKATEEAIRKEQVELRLMREKPELYRDPLTLFEVKLRQYEWIAETGEGASQPVAL